MGGVDCSLQLRDAVIGGRHRRLERAKNIVGNCQGGLQRRDGGVCHGQCLCCLRDARVEAGDLI